MRRVVAKKGSEWRRRKREGDKCKNEGPASSTGFNVMGGRYEVEC